MAARITGTVNTMRLRTALDAASLKHPLMRAKVIFDERHEAWFSSQGVPPVPMRIVTRTSEQQWLEELKEEACVPFDIGSGPLIKLVLMQSPEVSDLLIFANHGISDGIAIANLIRDILCLYDDPAQEVRVLDPSDVLDLIQPGISLKGIAARFFAGVGNRKWNKNPYYFGADEYTALYRCYWEKRKPGLVLLEFDPDESAQLLAACRSHGITVGSARSTTCLAARNDIIGEFPKQQQTVMVPFDLRPRLDPPVGNVFCFCDGGVKFPLSWSVKKTFWDNAADLHKEIHARIDVLDPSCLDIPEFEPSFIDALSAFSLFTDKIPEAYTRTETMQRFIEDTRNVAFSFNRNYEQSLPGFVPSNVGRIDILESPGSLHLDRLIFLPGISDHNPLSIGGAGAGGRMVFALPFVDPSAKTGTSPEVELIRIRDRMLEILGFPDKVNDKALG